ncbi:peptidoglycan DD-metalloendopeptidase family protein [Fulvivirga maritima]|uniref:peptidoglycan DD-metalloendopeptidase family protein n=1 Tax=Fulvivirga maritima TaxID=2904247 RepID=UPI001F188E3F|nr:peptidoglycan DD-metalloendopeptidase family protein [Fulvivirga maritima]UII28423.1 peptidoglycan DD-metalloendopeptidase family protein [Fulvivirga maritima]
MSKKYLGLIALALISVGSYFVIPTINDHQEISKEESEGSDSTSVSVAAVIPQPKLLYGVAIDSALVIEDKIKRNQNISEILTAHNVSTEAIFKLAAMSRDIFDVRKIAANKKYTLICDQDSLETAKAFVYEHNPIEYFVFNLKDSLSIQKFQKEVKVVEKGAAGVIESSLSVAMSDLGLPVQLTNDFVDVFAWQVDFFRLQRGDKFKVIYEDKMVDGQSVGIGEIKAIYFEHFGNDYYAYAFDQGEGANYFDESGNSLRKALLRYPLEFTRISSRYSGNRYHPVQKRWKAHRGTDFAAPKGTPIRSVGDGIIVDAKYSKYNGNYVKVRHNSTYTTQYLHMSKIASGIKAGVRVKQNQTIGFVGSTGLATGNHLCYRFWKNGVQIDALKVDLPPSEPIEETLRAKYEEEKNQWRKKLDEIHITVDKPVMASIN